MASLLLIGGSGFFGKSILESFHLKKLEIWSVDKVIVMSRHPESLKIECPHLLSHKVEFIKADIALAEVLPNADYIIHAAASTKIENYLRGTEAEKKNILGGVNNFVDLVLRGKNKPKILYASSGGVYGMQPTGVDFISENDFGKFDIDALAPGKKDYAIAKRDAEIAMNRLAASGHSVSIARCFAFVGKWLPLDQHFAIGNFLGDALQKRPIVVKSLNNVIRSYMYADDLVEWLMTIMLCGNENCPTYNVGSDEAIDLRSLACLVGKISGSEVILPDSVSDFTDRYIPCISKARNQFNLNVKYNVEDSIKMMLGKGL